jgi:hypothetical protein
VKVLIGQISGNIQLAPLGPDEWSVSFSPKLSEPVKNLPRGTVSTMTTGQAEVCLRGLGFEEERIAEVSQFKFENDELRPFEFEVSNAALTVLLNLGLISDKVGFNILTE